MAAAGGNATQPGSAPSEWRDQLDFMTAKAAKARRLLEQSEEHRGSQEMQNFVEAVDLSERLHATLLNHDCSRREDLSVHDKQWGLAALVRLAALESRTTVHSACIYALLDTAGEPQLEALPFIRRLFPAAVVDGSAPPMPASTSALPGSTPTWLLLGWVGIAWVTSSLGEAILHPGEVVRSMGDAARCLDTPAALAAVDAALAAAVPELQLTASQALAACLDLRLGTSAQVLQLDGAAQAAQLAAACLTLPAMVATRIVTLRRLTQLKPTRALHHTQLAFCLVEAGMRAEALAIARRGLEVAAQHKDWDQEARACFGVIALLCIGCSGPTVQRRELQQLQQRGQRALKLCKHWLPSADYLFSKKEAEMSAETLQQLYYRYPGQEQLPARGRVVIAVQQLEAHAPTCSHCGEGCPHLRKCAACKAVAYCSAECQRQHWKAPGGHKQECAALAAANPAGGQQRGS